MTIVAQFSWDAIASPDFGNPARQAWRAAVVEIADKAKVALPACNGRVEKAAAIVLAGDVELLEGGKAKVASQSNGQTTYFVVNGTCKCRDFPKAPSGWCQHRIAAGMAKRVTSLATAKLDAVANGQATPAQPFAALPEAPASVNVRLTLRGREVQLTLRDADEDRLLARLDAILQRFPVAAKPADDTPHCSQHGVPLVLQHGKDGGTWYSHQTANGWCKGR